MFEGDDGVDNASVNEMVHLQVEVEQTAPADIDSTNNRIMEGPQLKQKQLTTDKVCTDSKEKDVSKVTQEEHNDSEMVHLQIEQNAPPPNTHEAADDKGSEKQQQTSWRY